MCSCTAVSVDYTKEDGTHFVGSYVSTKTQENPQFTLNKSDDTVTVTAGATKADGVDKEEVKKALGTIVDTLLFPPPPVP